MRANYTLRIRNYALLLGIVCLIMLLTSCGNRRAISKLQPTSIERITDSVYVLEKIVPRDTLITIAPDSVQLRVLLSDLPENKPVAVKSHSGMEVQIVRVADTLIVDCATQTRELWIALADKVKLIKQLKKQSKTIYVPTKFIPWWVKALAWTGGIAIALLAIGRIVK